MNRHRLVSALVKLIQSHDLLNIAHLQAKRSNLAARPAENMRIAKISSSM